ncbi:SsgA family sporulation/cell division regulator [Streptomyces sp. NPDC098077]|uniref:SsgA family sporulation/cell division regulator n=1 Tax=Streptomyces sp. NPDC098077 TaxID=3366093 RepID=UPI0037F45260
MNNSRHGPVEALCSMRLHVAESQAYVSIAAFLHYSQRDPYAVRFRFWLDSFGDPVEWYIGRELLRDGLLHLVGEGDVQIGPDQNSAAILIRLRVDEHSSTMTVPRQPVAGFLHRTAKAVPYGCESQAPGFVDLRDAALERLSSEI